LLEIVIPRESKKKTGHHTVAPIFGSVDQFS